MIVGFLSFFILLSLVQAYYLNLFNTETVEKIGEIKEETRPASLQITQIIDSSCKNCFDVNKINNVIQELNVNITSFETLELTSAKAKQLITQYNILKVPVEIISGETSKSSVVSFWNQVGARKIDDVVIIESIPPYKDITTNQVKGLVSLIMLTDNSCSSCYNVTLHKLILPTYGVFVVNETTYDINSDKGKELVNKYNITKVPTIMLSPDANVYSTLNQIWKQVGSIGSDGWFIFRATEQMGNYTDLTTGKLVIVK